MTEENSVATANDIYSRKQAYIRKKSLLGWIICSNSVCFYVLMVVHE